MILIIDSGASKADWLFLNNGIEIGRFETQGINPVSNANEGNMSNPSDFDAFLVDSIFYYGAGVMGDLAKKTVREKLKSIFTNAEQIEINSDLLGAARAVSAGKASIVAILGTGSNSCLFDGKDIATQLPSFGYLLGDEGSGFHIGKEIIKSYYYGYMPEHDRDRFEASYETELSKLLRSLYRSEKPNYSVASYAIFLKDCEQAYQNYILERVFQSFIDNRIKPIAGGNNYPINFCGSVAYNYQDVLIRICEMNGYQVDVIIERPIEAIKEYHKNI